VASLTGLRFDRHVETSWQGRTSPGPVPRWTGWRRDLVTAGLSAWLLLGVFLDGWAHNTRPSLETFFTPWHAVFYSGFLALAGWILRVAWPRRQSAGGASAPVGYRLAVWGVVVFGLSGLGDMLWHLTFGIERELAALLSPTHLGLYLGALLMVTAPFRSAWADRGDSARRWGLLLPASISLALAGCLTAFILQPFHPFAFNFVSRRLAASILERYPHSFFVTARNTEAGLAGFMLATVFLFGPVLVLLYRWRPPRGMVAAMLILQCVAMQGMRGFREPTLVLFGGLGAVAVETLIWILRPEGASLGRLRAFCAVGPPLFWGMYLGGMALRDGGLGWSPEVWGGALVWTGLTLLAPTVVMSPHPGRDAGHLGAGALPEVQRVLQ
jgi:hypothetical protein